MKRLILRDDERVGPWVCSRNGNVPWNPAGCSTIGIESDGELVGGVIYEKWNKASIFMHVASDGSRRWMTREFLWLVFHYPFEQLGVNKVIGMVESTNTRALEFDLNLGFVEEARIPGACRGGDLVFLTMTREQCRFLSWRVKE